MDIWRRGTTEDISTMGEHAVIRVRSAARVLTQHYWDRIEGRTDSVRPAGGVLGKTLWVDVALRLDDGPPVEINDLSANFDEWLSAALSRARHDAVSFREVADGVFRADFAPGRAATPLLFAESLRRLELDGGPAVMIPRDDILIVTGLNDEAGLAKMADYVVGLVIGESERTSFIPMTRDEHDNTWTQLLAERRFDQLTVYRDLRLRELERDYREQGAALAKLSGAVAIAPYQLEAVRSTRPLDAVTRLEEGSESLLPQAETVLLVPADGGGTRVVDFRQLATLIQGVFEPQGLIPERYLVRIFPNETQRQRLTDLRRKERLKIL